MWKWVLVLILAGRMIATATSCGTDPDGSACLLIDGQTVGLCKGGACTRTFTVPAGEARTGTGTISSSGGTVTGSGTAFLSEVSVGDVLRAAGQTVTVASVANDTSLITVPALTPALTGTSFTFQNPIMKLLDSNGAAQLIIDPRGYISNFGYAISPLNIAATVMPSGLPAPNMQISCTTGGLATSSVAAGSGGNFLLNAGDGGASSISGKAAGLGGAFITQGGTGGIHTTGSGANGGENRISGGQGGCGSSGNITGSGGNAIITGGLTGTSCTSTGGNVGNVIIGENGGQTRIGTSAQTVADNTTGGFTKIRGVTVSAFPPANAVGFMKNDGSGNYSLAPLATADLPAAAQNAINAFVHANAGGI